MHPGVISGRFRHLGLERPAFVNCRVASQDLNNATVCPQSSFLPLELTAPEAVGRTVCLPLPVHRQASSFKPAFPQTFDQRCQASHRNGLKHEHFSLSANFARQSEGSEGGWEDGEKHPKRPPQDLVCKKLYLYLNLLQVWGQSVPSIPKEMERETHSQWRQKKIEIRCLAPRNDMVGCNTACSFIYTW